MSDADMGYFNQWFSDAYSVANPDNPITDTGIKTITIVVTEACNLACTYCYQHQKTQRYLTKETAKEIVDFLLDDSKINNYFNVDDFPCVVFDFIGGEPLLNIEVMDYFMDYFKFQSMLLNHRWQNNYMISISSNGVLYLDEKVQRFVEKNKNRMSFGITIDGTKELHDSCRVFPDGRGSYDIVEASVKKWVNDVPFPNTKVTIVPENLDYLVESVIHLFNLGVAVVPANVVFENVWTDINDATKFYNLLKELGDKIIDEEWYTKKYTSLFSEQIGTPLPEEENTNWCGGDGKMLAIGVDGTCYPCLRYMEYCLENKYRKPITTGNIYEGLNNCQTCSTLKGLTEITRRSQSTDKCFHCPVGRGCQWCTAYNYDLFGTPDKRATFHCSMHQARVLANVYYWNKLYKKLNLNKSFPLHLPKDWAMEIIDENEYEMLKALSEEREEM